MKALFPPWTNTVARLGVFLLVGVPIALVAFLMALVRTPYVLEYGEPLEQPIAFDHRHHVRDDEVDCRFCHFLVERSPHAGVPPTSLCMGCHNQIWSDSSLLRPLRESAFSGEPIRWRRVYQLPDFVRFDHAAHVTRGVGCSSCHGRVDLMASVYRAVPTTMAWCLDCHRNPTPSLRPLDRITDMTWPAPPRFVTGLSLNTKPMPAVLAGDGADDAVRPPTSCSGCHR